MKSCLDLTGRVAVVFGATSGLGRVIARGLAVFGAHVVPTGRRTEQVEAACREVEALGRRTLPAVADVCDAESIVRLRELVVKEFSAIDILVNAAGVTARQPTVDVDEEQWGRLLDTNLTGTLRSCQAFYPDLKASGRGRIINIASLGSFRGFYEVAAYCAAKTAVAGLTRSLAVEWAHDRICVNAIAPGVFPTHLNSAIINGTPRGQEILARTPMKRFGQPEELIGTAVLLASDAASFITGQCIAVDGGYLASGVNV